jgi:hypothetical protein
MACPLVLRRAGGRNKRKKEETETGFIEHMQGIGWRLELLNA